METNINLKGRKFNGQYYPKSNVSGKSLGKRYASYYGHLSHLTNRKLTANIPAKVDHPQTQLENH
ncbi:MAG TPA: hypothetical protein VGM63_09600 [Mucilaginibacter sp.]|jgi:hypothetical protein